MTYEQSLERQRQIEEAVGTLRLVMLVTIGDQIHMHNLTVKQADGVVAALLDTLLKPEFRRIFQTLSEGA